MHELSSFFCIFRKKTTSTRNLNIGETNREEDGEERQLWKRDWSEFYSGQYVTACVFTDLEI